MGEVLVRCAPGLEGVLAGELGGGEVWAGAVVAGAGAARVRALRAADSAWAFLWGSRRFPRDAEGAFRALRALPSAVDWAAALETVRAWNPGAPPSDDVLRFRVTCVRNHHLGEAPHGFRSMEAAGVLGEAVGRHRPGWQASMTRFEVEVMLVVLGDQALLGLHLIYAGRGGCPGHPLQPGAEQMPHRAHARQLHGRPYLSARVKTTLRPSRAYALLRLAEVRPGDLVLDPCAGAAVVPLEAAASFRSVWGLAGDLDPAAVHEVAAANYRLGPRQCDAPLRWDAANLPLRDGSVDVVISDLPFGVGCGKARWLQHLYRWVIFEVARVLRPGSGRAVLLLQGTDAEAHLRELAASSGVVTVPSALEVNMEGIPVRAVLFRRTSVPAASRAFPSGKVAQLLRTTKASLGCARPEANAASGEAEGEAPPPRKLSKRARKKRKRGLRRQVQNPGSAGGEGDGVPEEAAAGRKPGKAPVAATAALPAG